MPKLDPTFIFSSLFKEQFLYSVTSTKKFNKFCIQYTTTSLERCLIKNNKSDAFGSLIGFNIHRESADF